MINRKDFEQLYDDYYSGLFAYAHRYVLARNVAEDIVHDVYCSLWENRKNLDFCTSGKSYLYSSVKNRSLNYLKHNDVHSRYEQVMLMDGEPSQFFGGDDFEQNSMEKYVFGEIEKLPPELRDVFILNKMDGLTAKSIAEQSGVSVRTVEGQIARAMKIIKKNAQNLKWLLPFIYNLPKFFC